MELVEYNFIKSRLNEPKDVDFISEMMGYKKNMLFNILARKIVRKVMRDYYKIKRMSKRLLNMWNKGKTFSQLAKGFDFSPVIMALFILQEKGWRKKEFQELLKNPNKIENKKIKEEIKEALEKDFVYSPKSVDRQVINGREGEDKMQKWLDKNKIKYLTENDIKAAAEDQQDIKTPDFLFKKSIKINGKESFWLESKASFGSPNEMKRNYKKQLNPYEKLFGPGIVIYWYGFVEDYPISKDTQIGDGTFFDSAKVKK